MESYRSRLNALMAEYMRYSMMQGLNPRDMDTDAGRMYTSLFMEHQRMRDAGYQGSEELLLRGQELLEQLKSTRQC